MQGALYSITTCVIKFSSQTILLRATWIESTTGPCFHLMLLVNALQCNVCDKDFKSSCTLKCHMKKKHHRPRFHLMLLVNAHCIVVNANCIAVNAQCIVQHCNVCNKDFKSGNTFKRHMRKKHHRALIPSDSSSQCTLHCSQCKVHCTASQRVW